MTILIFIAVLVVLVVVHELGHFAVAKLARVKVLEFGVGYPPRIASVTRGETTYSLNLLPLGGFVRMLGEEDPSAPESFAAQSALRRLAVLAAGPAMNVVLPIVLFTLVFMLPQPVVVTDVAVLDVAPGSPAQAAGVMPGDLVRTVDGRTIDNSADLQTAVHLRLGADMTWTVERQGRLVELAVPEARIAPPPGEGAVGILLADGRLTVESVERGSAADRIGLRAGDLLLRVASSRVLSEGAPEAAAAAALEAAPRAPVNVDVLRNAGLVTLELAPDSGALDGLAVSVRPEEQRSMGFLAAFGASFRQIGDVLVLFRNEVSRWIAGAASVELAGPIGIAQITGDVAQAGLSPLVLWTALLSLNLAIINLLPVPALDGGRIAFILLELARGGRRLAPEKERLVHLAGFLLLIGAIAAVSVNDIQRLISGGSIIGQ